MERDKYTIPELASEAHLLPSEVEGFSDYLDRLGFKMDEGVYKPAAIKALNILRTRLSHPKERIKVGDRLFDVEEFEKAEEGGLEIGAYISVTEGGNVHIFQVTNIDTATYSGCKIYYAEESVTVPVGTKPATIRAKALKPSDLDGDTENIIEEVRGSIEDGTKPDSGEFDPLSDLVDLPKPETKT